MFGNGHEPLRGPGRKKQIGFDHFGERAVGEIGLRIDQGFAGLDNVPNRTLPTLINARRPRDHRIVQFSLLVHFQTFRSQKFGQEFPHNVRRPLIVAARGEYVA
jgi:hypothetical protein